MTLLVCTLLGICPGSPGLPSAAGRETVAAFRIGATGNDAFDRDTRALLDSIRRELESLAQERMLGIEWIESSPEHGSREAQVAAMGDVYEVGVDAFILELQAGDGAPRFWSLIADTAETLIAVGAQPKDPEPLIFARRDPEAEGRAMAALAREVFPAQSRIAVLAGDLSTADQRTRLTSFLQAWHQLDRRDQSLEAIHPFQGGEEEAVERVARIRAEDRDDRIDGWICLGPWLFEGGPSFPWRAGEYRMVALNTGPAAYASMRAGYLHGVVVRDYGKWAAQLAPPILDHLYHGRIPAPGIRLCPVRAFSARQASAYNRAWASWLD